MKAIFSLCFLFVIGINASYGTGIQSITVYEQTAAVYSFTFLTNDSKLEPIPSDLFNPFHPGGIVFDFGPGGSEVYDIFISESD